MRTKPQTAGAPTKKQLSRREMEQRQRRILFIFGAVTLALVALVLAFGYYQEYVVKPAAPVATVNGKVITRRDYQALVRYQRFRLASTVATLQAQLSSLDPTIEEQQFLVQYLQQQLQQVQAQGASLPPDVIDGMIDDELIRQEAAQRNILVTPEDVDVDIEQQFGFERNPPTPTPTPITATAAISVTPTPTEAPMTKDQFQKSYTEYVIAVRKNARYSEAAFRRLFESDLYRRKLNEVFEAEVPLTAEQVHASHILVATEDEAKKVIERLQAGEEFAALAKELSTDTSNKDTGGDLGWFPRGRMVTEFENAAFALQPGQTSDPVQTTYGYHIVHLIEHDASRALDEDTLAQARSSALDDWLSAQRKSDAVKSFWSSLDIPLE